MLEQYKPVNYGEEYVEFCGSSQYPMFVATALGVKPCFDDWVPCNKYGEFVGICKEYGLFVEPDVVFVKTSLDKKQVVGGDTITTTFTEVVPFKENAKNGQVHVFVSKAKDQAIRTRRCGWYPGIISGRSVNKPFVDHMRFGKNLGFPECCVDFFRKYNNWAKYSHPYESYNSTPNKSSPSSYYCNNFTMDFIYFYIHHIPCNFKCDATIASAKVVENKIKDDEPKFVEKTNKILKSPLLVFGERNFILFEEGNYSKGELKYKKTKYISNYARKEDRVGFINDVQKGNSLFFKDKKLCVEKNENLIIDFQ